ncbi:hypothetical protein [Natrialba swarupiae]|uniref:DUF8160 domain-containing protein n=1 Tax=Natrialba swarupiae TaxID=2448032 RepID=A0A5D5AJC8_9EURY|nr:hypothetical protein [Natrialba swarupiae]TYT60927.1 hypothetical protein FYC77_16090 [Natrialba swarupiae]
MADGSESDGANEGADDGGSVDPVLPGVDDTSGDDEPEITYDLDDLGNVKEEWEGVTIYLPSDLHNALNLSYRELSYESARTTSYDLQKLQDFYPLLVAVGLNNLNQSDTDDLLSMLEYLQEEYG